ncbi:MAG TPA: cobalt ECF transporter T component CbiQ [Actinomycetota bacterium]|nr:cobalt ECF transporter T component CbiQ [Actinomycetota bacterium]
MSGGHTHGHGLFVHGHSRLHTLAPQCKVAGALAFVLVVVATPREAFWAYGVYAGLIVALTLNARVPPLTLLRRLAIETPFLIFVVALPFVARGERLDIAGLSLSVEGLWGAWNIFVKATLGAAAMMLLASTTPITSILHGLQKLRVPSVIVAIAGFMIRYADVIASEMRRMKVGRQSRGYEPRVLWQARALASSAGTLFIRSYERGERVHLAMMSRGYSGTMPELAEVDASPTDWLTAFLVPAVAAMICVLAWL